MPWDNLRAELEGMFDELDGNASLEDALYHHRVSEQANHNAYLKEWRKRKKKDPAWKQKQKDYQRTWYERLKADPARWAAKKAHFAEWQRKQKEAGRSPRSPHAKPPPLSEERKARKKLTDKQWKRRKIQNDPAWVERERQKKKAAYAKKKQIPGWLAQENERKRLYRNQRTRLTAPPKKPSP